MKVLSFFILFLFPYILFAQFNVNGKLESNNTPVANCSVRLIQTDKVVKTSISDENGFFEFQNIPEGKYRLEVVSIFL